MKDVAWQSALAFCLALFVLSILVRGVFGERYGVTINDLIILILPFILWLFATGQVSLSSFELGGGSMTLKAVFRDAGNKPVEVTRLPIEQVTSADKGTLDQLRPILDRRVAALSLHLNSNNYYDPYVLGEYLKALSGQPSFKWLVISDQSARFVGMIDASRLASSLLANPELPTRLAHILNKAEPLTSLGAIDGFLPATLAITASTTVESALQKMEAENLPYLPVVDQDQHFAGVVDRSRLTTSLVLNVSRSLQTNTPAAK